MTDSCYNCGQEFGYDPDWDDPPKGEGYIQVTHNPADEPDFVVAQTQRYCSMSCLQECDEGVPFGGNND